MPAEEHEDRPVALLRLVNANRDSAVAAHQRVSGRIKGLDDQVADLERVQTEHATRLTLIEKTPPPAPPDVTQLKFTPPVVVFVVSTVLSIAGGMWASTYGLRSDVRDILTQMSARERADSLKETIQSERFATMQKAIEAMQRQQAMQQYETQALKELVLKGGLK